MKPNHRIILTIVLFSFQAFYLKALNSEIDSLKPILTDSLTSIQIDTVTLERNWRTKDKIIMNEIEFEPGKTYRKGEIDTMVLKVDNIGNFVTVDHRLNKMDDGRNNLTIVAKDAFTVYPIFKYDGNSEDFKLDIGLKDENFLGRNMTLKVKYGHYSTGDRIDVNFQVPRQLLYKNMTLEFGTKKGDSKFYQWEDNKKQSVIAYDYFEIYGKIGHPNHQDFEYVFSPNLEYKYFRHQTNPELLDSADYNLPEPVYEYYTYNCLQLALYESIGKVNWKRFRKDGHLIYVRPFVGIGLDKESPAFFKFEYGAQYYKIFNKWFQFSSDFDSGITTSNVPSNWYYKGSDDVFGYKTGEITGKCFYKLYVGVNFTYFNHEWFALEHTVFGNIGNGADKYFDLFTTSQKASIGTSFLFKIPMVKFFQMKFSFSYAGKNSNWFDFEFL